MYVVRTVGTNANFQALVTELDAFLAGIYGDEQAIYDQFNSSLQLQHVVLVYENDKPIACGAFQILASGPAEIKRMFTVPESRGKGAAKLILQYLEVWGKELDITKLLLETGNQQFAALKVYESAGFTPIPNYEPYVNMKNSICMLKNI